MMDGRERGEREGKGIHERVNEAGSCTRGQREGEVGKG